MTNPLRKEGLFSTEVDGQELIYDATSRRTHCLNPQALKVWKLCDGRHSRDDMVRVLNRQSGDAEDLVDAALDRFAALEMLDAGTLPSRRDIGKAAVKALAAGLVLSVLVPTRAAAASACESIEDPINCLKSNCEWSGGACVVPGAGSECESIEDEEQCNSNDSCIWIGVCISSGG